MNRAMPPNPIIHGPRKRANSTSRVLILSEDTQLGTYLRRELRHLLAEPWFGVFQSIDHYRASLDGDVIYDLVAYCVGSDEQPTDVTRAIDRIKLFCPEPELKIVLYTANRETPTDTHIAAIVHQPDVTALANEINQQLRPEAA